MPNFVEGNKYITEVFDELSQTTQISTFGYSKLVFLVAASTAAKKIQSSAFLALSKDGVSPSRERFLNYHKYELMSSYKASHSTPEPCLEVLLKADKNEVPTGLIRTTDNLLEALYLACHYDSAETRIVVLDVGDFKKFDLLTENQDIKMEQLLFPKKPYYIPSDRSSYGANYGIGYITGFMELDQTTALKTIEIDDLKKELILGWLDLFYKQREVATFGSTNLADDLVKKASSLYQQKRFLEAKDTALYAVNSTNDSRIQSDAYALCGEAYLSLHMYKEANEAFSNATLCDESNARAQAGGGSAKLKLGLYKEAISNLTKSIEIEPEDTDTYLARAEAYLMDEAYLDAVVDASDVIELDPNNLSAYSLRAKSYIKNEDFEQALGDLDIVLERTKQLASENKATKAYTEPRILRAKTLLELSRYEEALEELYVLDPSTREVRILRAKLNDLNKNYKEALEDYRYILDIETKDAKTMFECGKLSLLLDDPKQAIEDINGAVKLGFFDENIGVLLGKAYFYIKDFTSAVKHFNTVLENDPSNDEIRLLRGRAKSTLGQVEEAAIDFEKEPKVKLDSEILMERAENNLTLGRDEEALLDFQKILEKDQTNTEVLKKVGLLYAKLDKSNEAIDSLTKTVQLGEGDFETYTTRAKMLTKLGSFDDAIYDLKCALDIDKSSGETHYQMAKLYMDELEDFDKALQKFEDAEKNGFYSAKLYLAKAVLNTKLNDFDNALKELDKSINLGPTAEAYVKRGTYKNVKGEYELAAQDCNEAIALDPNCADAYVIRSKSRQGLMRYDEAIMDCLQAIDISPSKDKAYASLAQSQFRLKRFEEAFSNCQRALELNQENADAYATRGIINTNLRRLEDGSKDLKMALKLANEQGDFKLGEVVQKSYKRYFG